MVFREKAPTQLNRVTPSNGVTFNIIHEDTLFTQSMRHCLEQTVSEPPSEQLVAMLKRQTFLVVTDPDPTGIFFPQNSKSKIVESLL